MWSEVSGGASAATVHTPYEAGASRWEKPALMLGNTVDEKRESLLAWATEHGLVGTQVPAW